MRHPINPVLRLSQSLSFSVKGFIAPVLGLMMGLGSTVIHHPAVNAATPDTAPPEIKSILTKIDAAANNHNLSAVMQFYSPNFTNSDGLDSETMQKALTQLWQRYPNLNYRTEIQSWQAQGNNITTQTVTYINGTQSIDGKDLKFESTLRSRQYFKEMKIVQQDILTERTQLSSGTNPPTVQMTLPEQLRIGQDYNFDAIVKEPLGNDLLMGTAIEESVQPTRYFKSQPLNLELLQSGGIFKIGQAPTKKGSYWISAILVRTGGMTLITQRLQVN